MTSITFFKHGTWCALFFTTTMALDTSASAQTYSLEECIAIALEQNSQMTNRALEVRSAGFKTAEIKGALLPKVDINNQYLYYLELPSQYAPSSAFGGPEGEYSKLSLNMPQTMSSALQVNQTILNKELSVQLKASRVVESATLLRMELTREEITYNVSATYYRIQILQDNSVRVAENITNLEQTVSISSVLKDNELIANNVHHRLLISLDNLRNEFESLELNIRNQQTLLKYLMQVDINEAIIIEPFREQDPIPLSWSGDISERADLQLQHIEISLAEYEMRRIRAKYSPQVTAGFSTGFTGYNDGFAPHQQINDDWINSTSVSLNMHIPIFAGFQKKSQFAQQQLTIQKSMNTLSKMQSQAEREVMDATDQYHTYQNQLSNSTMSLDIATQLFESAQGDYASGISTLTDLLNAQNDLSDARTNYSTALLNIKLAQLSLQKAYGLL